MLALLNLIRRSPALYEVGVTLRDYKSYVLGARRGSFSQHGEDVFVFDYFKGKRDGHYLDIGASHPFRISNTYLLYSRGWTGVTVEPIPRLGALHKKWRPRDKLLLSAVGSASRKMPFFEMTPSVLSTLDENIARYYVANGKAVVCRTFDIHVMSIDAVFAHAAQGAPIDFVSIDIEGLDAELLGLVELDRYKPALICVEANDTSSRKKIEDTFQKSKYKVVHELGCNLFAAPN